MTKWEYRTATLPAYKSGGLFALATLETEVLADTLKDYGNDGWELISQSFAGDINHGLCDMLLIFKRPKE